MALRAYGAARSALMALRAAHSHSQRWGTGDVRQCSLVHWGCAPVLAADSVWMLKMANSHTHMGVTARRRAATQVCSARTVSEEELALQQRQAN